VKSPNRSSWTGFACGFRDTRSSGDEGQTAGVELAIHYEIRTVSTNKVGIRMLKCVLRAVLAKLEADDEITQEVDPVESSRTRTMKIA
jgi:hypothetical protein